MQHTINIPRSPPIKMSDLEKTQSRKILRLIRCNSKQTTIRVTFVFKELLSVSKHVKDSNKIMTKAIQEIYTNQH